jgi:hypothetical protein
MSFLAHLTYTYPYDPQEFPLDLPSRVVLFQLLLADRYYISARRKRHALDRQSLIVDIREGHLCGFAGLGINMKGGIDKACNRLCSGNGPRGVCANAFNFACAPGFVLGYFLTAIAGCSGLLKEISTVHCSLTLFGSRGDNFSKTLGQWAPDWHRVVAALFIRRVGNVAIKPSAVEIYARVKAISFPV